MAQKRRGFLKTLIPLAALPVLDNFNLSVKHQPLLSFSTLGCPKWSFQQIVNVAAVNGYQGLEIRGILGEMYLPKCPEFSVQNLPATLRLMADNKLKFVDLGSSANMHFIDAAKRKTNLDEAKRYVDLAHQLHCPNIRVFPNDLPKDQKEEETIENIIKNLIELGEYSKGSSVNVLMESHGKIVHSDLLLKIMQSVNHPHVGLVWDYFNMWSITKEPPKEVFQKLKKYIKHTHIKDAKFVDGKEQYTLLGEGEAPLAEALTALKTGGYKGFYSFEWEKLWHPEIQEPEIAIPHFSKTIPKYF